MYRYRVEYSTHGECKLPENSSYLSDFQATNSESLRVLYLYFSVTESTRSRIPTLEISLEGTKNRLAVLLGVTSGELHARLAAGKSIPSARQDIALGIPANTIRQRPDVRRAERELAAATARIGSAMAELYPEFALSGFFGWDALSGGDLFDSRSRTESVSAGVFAPIFNAGRIRNRIVAQTAIQEQALAQYESTILEAIEEVENSLVAYSQEQDRRDALKKAAEAAERAVDLAQTEYTAGITDFRDVLDAQRSLLAFQDQLTESEGLVTAYVITLYKALGGGWASES